MAWWGSWGHVFPIKSLLEWIYKKPQYVQRIDKIYWFGTQNSLESQICEELNVLEWNIKFVSILSGKYRRETLRISRWKNIRDVFLFVAGFFQAFFRLLRYRIDVIFCKWWYVALPVVFAAAILQRTIIVHESDTHAWLVNRIANCFASKIFTWFDGVFSKAKTVGQILSDDILVETPHSNWEHHKAKILINGWSQWSRKLYQTILHILQNHTQACSSFDFYIILGLLSQQMAKDFEVFPNVHTVGFISQRELGELYAMCDISITRWGTTSLAEQKLYNIKQIIIPIPWTHDQYDNAQWYVDHYKDIMLSQKDIAFEEKLTSALMKLRTFNKKDSKKNKQAQISRTKEIIVKTILSI